jgi:hypothetical protein
MNNAFAYQALIAIQPQLEADGFAGGWWSWVPYAVHVLGCSAIEAFWHCNIQRQFISHMNCRCIYQ